VLSALVHAGLCIALLIGASIWRANQPKIYVVNLVPAVAAVGVPQSRPAPPAPTPPPPVPVKETPAPPAPKAPTPDLPKRSEPVRASVPEMPSRERTPAALPERTLPVRTPTPPRPQTKELPPVASAITKPTPAMPPPTPATTVARRDPTPAPPPPPVGQPTGSPRGSGPVTLNVGDFPYAWYIRIIHGKISERWDGNARDGLQPIAVFDITRDGQVSRLKIERTSGNADYDRIALRAIADANPFPPLPEDFKEPTLRVRLGFQYQGPRG
jgi:TonB family protein